MRMVGSLLGQHFYHTIHFPTAAVADLVQVIRARKVGENVGNVLGHCGVADSELPKTLTHGLEKKAVQSAVGCFIFHRSKRNNTKVTISCKESFCAFSSY